ncbi:MAG: hypothetical protein M1576_03385 [Deltaproteobacteria bacterium]|jgi:hypothetical protein|nr:hypothetical protein [Deltaproteobacteria bacterium]
MRYFVHCKEHPEEKIYVDFGKQIFDKNELDYPCFSLACPKSGNTHTYSLNEISAEPGVAIGGGILGALLFFLDPIAGIIGTITGLAAGLKNEQEKVEKFNNSLYRKAC